MVRAIARYAFVALVLLASQRDAFAAIPVADFFCEPRSGTAPLIVVCDDASLNVPTSWIWDCDTTVSTSDFTTQTAACAYSAPGTYTVLLFVQNADGVSSNTKTGYVTVTAVNPPVASFTGTPLSGAAPLVVQFSDTSTGSPTAWEWDCDTTEITVDSEAQHPFCLYDTPGVYTQKLTAYNEAGSDSQYAIDYITVTAPPAPVAAFSGTPLSGTGQLSVVLTDSSSGPPASWEWDCDTSTPSVDFTSKNATCSYFEPGTYTVGLTATNATGSDAEVKTAYVTVSAVPSTGKWGPGVISSPSYGWIDSPFISYDGNRIYFMHTPYTILDFANDPAGVTASFPVGPYLPGAQIDPAHPKFTDLFFIEWNTGTSTWSAPATVGDINTASNGECCIWLSDDELVAVFHRDGVDGKVNVRAHRSTKNDTDWIEDYSFEPGLWAANTPTDYRADVAFSPVTFEAFATQVRAASVSSNLSRIVRSSQSASPPYSGTSNVTAYYPGLDASGVDETQPYISRSELTMLFNRRSSGKPTTLWRTTRSSPTTTIWEAPLEVTTTGFTDSIGSGLWGEISMDQTEAFAIAVIFDTTVPGWTSRLVHSVGTPNGSFARPTWLSTVNMPSSARVGRGTKVSAGSLK